MGIERDLNGKAEDIAHMVVTHAERSADFTLDPEHRSLIDKASQLAILAGSGLVNELATPTDKVADYDTPIIGFPEEFIKPTMQYPSIQLEFPNITGEN